MKTLQLKLYAGDGTTYLGELPSFQEISPMLTLNDVGSFSLSYPRNGIRASLLDQSADREIAVLIDGTERARYLVEDDGRDEIDQDKSRATLDIAGREVSQLLDLVRVYPINGVGTLPATHKFLSTKAGSIINTLLQRGQQRGAAPGWTTSFTSTTDSNGQAWNTNITFEYKTTATLLDVIKHMAQTLGVIDWRVSGRTIHAYNANTFMRQDKTNAVFSRGRDLSRSEYQRSRRDVNTVILVEGDDGKTVERTDSSAVSLRGRKEGYFSQSGTTDVGTLAVIGDLQLGFKSAPKEARPISVNFRDATPQPFTGFNVGDFAYIEAGDPPVNLRQRVVRLSLTMKPSGVFTGEIDFNDIFEEREIIADRMIRAASGNIGTGGATTVRSTGTKDTLAPGQVAQPSASSTAYRTANDIFAQVSASWLQLTQNTDGTAIDDLAYYEVNFRYQVEGTWRYVGQTTGTSIDWSSLAINQNVDIRVRAVDTSANVGAWSPSQSIVTGNDVTPPEKPSTPIVDNYLGLLRVLWDGGTSSGAAVAPDQRVCEVHISTTNDFTPDLAKNSATRIDSLVTGGYSFAEVPYGTTYYVKLVAVDLVGNYSTPSDQASAQASQVVSADVFDGAIGTAKLADLAVTTAKINDLAVNNAKIGSLDVGKLTAGTLSVAVAVTGRLATALAGRRVELNGTGLMAYNSSGVQTFFLSAATGSVVAMGTFQSGLSSAPYAELTSAVYGRSFPGLELNLGPTYAGLAFMPSVFVSPTQGGTNTMWVTSWETNANSSGRSDLNLHPNRWFLGHSFGTSGAYILSERDNLNGAIRFYLLNGQMFFFQSGHLGLTQDLTGNKQQAGNNRAGMTAGGSLRSGFTDNSMWFSWEGGYFRLWVDNTNVANITGDGRYL